jgi:hypothetical protein
MENSKYIVVEIFCGPVGMKMEMETPILFPAYIGHIDMARSLGITPDDVLAAGFVQIATKEHLHCDLPFHVVEVTAYGKSTSLGVESREEDSDLIRKALALED